MDEFQKLLSEQFLEMRWRCLSLAADMDRLQRAGSDLIHTDAHLANLRKALMIVADAEPNRAERIQMVFSDKSSNTAG